MSGRTCAAKGASGAAPGASGKSNPFMARATSGQVSRPPPSTAPAEAFDSAMRKSRRRKPAQVSNRGIGHSTKFILSDQDEVTEGTGVSRPAACDE